MAHLSCVATVVLQRAFTTCVCVFKVITLVGSNQRYYFENANTCSKRTLKTTVATQLYLNLRRIIIDGKVVTKKIVLKTNKKSVFKIISKLQNIAKQ